MAIEYIREARYLQDKEVFADALNFFLYEGNQVIVPENLEEIDLTGLKFPYEYQEGCAQLLEQIKEALPSIVCMKNSSTIFTITAVVKDISLPCSMPLLCRTVDTLIYVSQLKEKKYSVRLSENEDGIYFEESSPEFTKEDRLIPAVDITIHFSSDKWDGSDSFRDLFSVPDKRLLNLIPENKLNLIDPASMEDQEFLKFHSSLGRTLAACKYGNDPEKAEKILKSDDWFQYLKTAQAVLK